MMDWESDPELKKMHGEFVVSLSERHAALAVHLKALEKSQDQIGPKDTLKEIRLIAHRLAGVAESFGFSELGEVAAVLDDSLFEILEKGGMNATRDQIIRLTQNLLKDLGAEAGI